VLPRGDVVVDVHRRARLGVTEALTHHLDVGARQVQQAGTGMALVMNVDAGHSGLTGPTRSGPRGGWRACVR
jgi:hypothetical protein